MSLTQRFNIFLLLLIFSICIHAQTSVHENLFLQNQKTFARIKQTYFIKNLQSGKLPKAEFIRFLQRDTKYLTSFKQAMLNIANKFPADDPLNKLYLGFAEATQAEYDFLQQQYLQDISSAPTTDCKSCQAYGQHLLNTTKNGSTAEAVAATMPCFVFFAKLGKYLQAQGYANDNPYKAWIDAYADPNLDILIQEVNNTADLLARQSPEQILKMENAYKKSAKFELKFFENAFKNG